MSESREELIKFSTAEAVIEPLQGGGIVEHAIDGPQPSMEGIIQQHLATVAMLNARGDTAPERPIYVINPEARLLINYALRRHHNPDRSGLFADVVELDVNGNPRYGISAVNPFSTQTGFINVSVGENSQGFAPSQVKLHYESDDPATLIPPNIEMADLLTMLRGTLITADMTLTEFMTAKRAEQSEAHAGIKSRERATYRASEQALTAATNPNLHLIVTDRRDPAPLEAASRSVGIYPIVVTAKEFAEQVIQIQKMSRDGSTESIAHLVNNLSSYLPPRLRDAKHILGGDVPAFLTVDFENYLPDTHEDKQARMVEGAYVRKLDAWRVVEGKFGAQSNDGLLQVTPVFSKILNYRYPADPDEPEEVTRIAHGTYELAIDPLAPDNMQVYTDWLRKARLDFALTLYLRGLSKL